MAMVDYTPCMCIGCKRFRKDNPEPKPLEKIDVASFRLGFTAASFLALLIVWLR